MERVLRLVCRDPGVSPLPPPRCWISFDAESGTLVVEFKVFQGDPFVDPTLPVDRSVDRLWEHDVVEIFVSLASSSERVENSPYLEFQVSPLGQFLELRLLEPRKRDPLNQPLGLVASAHQDAHAWTARAEIQLKRHISPLHQDFIFGNVFSILGPPGKREYWSLFTPHQSQPDFHIPSQFKRLLIDG